MNTNQRVLTGVVVLLFMLGLISILPIHGEAKIYDTVVRLHVLANSDSEQDQALKLQVRDEVLRVTGPMLKDCKSRDEAVAVLQEHGDEIRDAAQAVVKAQGYDYPVSILLGKEQYPTRNYENCCFPGGTYVSMRVCIGEAEGQNWWCVLFPPLCLTTATEAKDTEAVCLSAGLTGEQYRVIADAESTTYRLRFKILEVAEAIFG